MIELNLLAVLVATLAAFVLGGAYYALLGDQLATVSEAAAAGQSPAPWKLALELVRCLVLTLVVATLAWCAGFHGLLGGLALGALLWIGFPLVLWTGAMLHEKTPFKLAAIHAGDWLLKLLLIAVIVSAWK